MPQRPNKDPRFSWRDGLGRLPLSYRMSSYRMRVQAGQFPRGTRRDGFAGMNE